MSGKKILIIEDEAKISRFIQLELEHEGYQVEQELDGRSGLDRALAESFDLIILDVMLPSLNGMEVLRRLRQVSEVPVIMLTAKGDVMDRVMGLETGADDYIPKPFAIEELLARIRVAFKHKRLPPPQSGLLQVGGLKLDKEKHTVFCRDEAVELTKKEFDLLQYLMLNRDIVISRERILEKVWGYDFAGDTNIVDVYIRYLRSKIDDRCGQKYIHTVRGVGYQLKDEE